MKKEIESHYLIFKSCSNKKIKNGKIYYVVEENEHDLLVRYNRSFYTINKDDELEFNDISDYQLSMEKVLKYLNFEFSYENLTEYHLITNSLKFDKTYDLTLSGFCDILLNFSKDELKFTNWDFYFALLLGIDPEVAGFSNYEMRLKDISLVNEHHLVNLYIHQFISLIERGDEKYIEDDINCLINDINITLNNYKKDISSRTFTNVEKKEILILVSSLLYKENLNINLPLLRKFREFLEEKVKEKDPKAIHLYLSMLLEGTAFMDKDYKKAEEMLLNEISKGNDCALYFRMLGDIYSNDSDNELFDYKKAIDNYYKGGILGDDFCFLSLANVYSKMKEEKINFDNYYALSILRFVIDKTKDKFYNGLDSEGIYPLSLALLALELKDSKDIIKNINPNHEISNLLEAQAALRKYSKNNPDMAGSFFYYIKEVNEVLRALRKVNKCKNDNSVGQIYSFKILDKLMDLNFSQMDAPYRLSFVDKVDDDYIFFIDSFSKKRSFLSFFEDKLTAYFSNKFYFCLKKIKSLNSFKKEIIFDDIKFEYNDDSALIFYFYHEGKIINVISGFLELFDFGYEFRPNDLYLANVYIDKINDTFYYLYKGKSLKKNDVVLLDFKDEEMEGKVIWCEKHNNMTLPIDESFLKYIKRKL